MASRNARAPKTAVASTNSAATRSFCVEAACRIGIGSTANSAAANSAGPVAKPSRRDPRYTQHARPTSARHWTSATYRSDAPIAIVHACRISAFGGDSS